MRSIERHPRTEMEVFKSLPEGTLAEIINGKIYMSPSPTTAHQRVLRRISSALINFVEREKTGGEIFFAPFDVFLDEHANAVQPDIIFVSGQNRLIVKEDAIHGTPDLLIEILPPGNIEHDLVRKKALYEKMGVLEFWIITPDTKETVGFFLKDGKYSESGRYVGVIRSAILDNTEFVF